MTQTSSPGGWQSRLSAFLHVHRGSRASSRKSSRASDASDLSELGGAWLNLPLLFLSSAHPAVGGASGIGLGDEHVETTNGNGNVCIMVSEPSPETGPIDIENNASKRVSDSCDGENGDQTSHNSDVSIMITKASPESAIPPVDTQSVGLKPSDAARSSPQSLASVDKDFNKEPYARRDSIFFDRGSSPDVSNSPKDRHPLGLLPGGNALSLCPDLNGVKHSNFPTRQMSETPLDHLEKHPVKLTPGGSVLSLPPSKPVIMVDQSPVAPPAPPERRSVRGRYAGDATLVHVLVHRESEETTDEKGS